MSKTFDAYANYYKFLYQDKDYGEESKYIAMFLKSQGVDDGAKWLDLGCGAGGHVFEFTKLGYQVHGIDLSENMIEVAKASCEESLDNVESNFPVFEIGDIKAIKLNKKFKAITCLFHVVGYLKSYNEFISFLKGIDEHLEPGGVCLFDYWHGPGVLTDPPSVRVKKFEDESMKILRIAQPTMNINSNSVGINFDVYVTDKQTGKVHDINETHNIRYYFEDELKYLVSIVSANLEVVLSSKWESDKKLTLNDWYGVMAIKKKNVS